MTVWIYQDGKLVEKPGGAGRISAFPTPRISRFEAMESPVTGKQVSSWRERDRDMEAAGAVDPRDIPKAVFEKRKALVERNERSESASNL
jgi:hypothetical protein